MEDCRIVLDDEAHRQGKETAPREEANTVRQSCGIARPWDERKTLVSTGI
jgi:hypothetical protein